jgi:RHS repeat-associated protein
VSEIDARQVTTAFVYDDPLARPTLTQFGNVSGPEDIVRTYDRDTLHQISSVNGGAYTFGYDDLNRTIEQQWSYGGRVYDTKYHFDTAGCRDTITYPTGTRLTAACDAKGRVTSLSAQFSGTGGSHVLADNVLYDAAGPITSMVYGNAKSAAFGVQNGRIMSINTPGVVDLSYTYDGAGSVTSVVDAISPNNNMSNIKYDGVNRLLDASTGVGNLSYRYDDLGNLKSKTVPGSGVTLYTYDPITNYLASSSGPSAPGLVTLGWNSMGMLSNSSDGSNYKYDGFARRVLFESPTSGTIVYHYDADGRLIAETQLDGTKIREYFYVADKLIAVDGCIAVVSPPCHGTQWYHTDLLGNVVARTDPMGNVVAKIAYHPWGEVISPIVGVAGSRLYNGNILDSGTGFFDYKARLYSASLGRFLTVDPTWRQPLDPQKTNLYAYALNNPLKYTDPSGSDATLANWLEKVSNLFETTKERAEKTQQKIAQAQEVVDKTAFILEKLPGGIEHAARLRELSEKLGSMSEEVEEVKKLAELGGKISEFSIALEAVSRVDLVNAKPEDRLEAAKAFDRLFAATGALGEELPKGPWTGYFKFLQEFGKGEGFFAKVAQPIVENQLRAEETLNLGNTAQPMETTP